MYNFKLEYGNIFDYVGRADCICVTTNGTIKGNGELVMGAGVAKQFYDRYKDLGIATILAKKLYKGTPLNKMHVVNSKDNICYLAIDAKYNQGTHVLSFPTKNHFMDKGDLELIKRSAHRAVLFADMYNLKSIIIPSPGTGCGKLKEEDVYNAINEILDERFTIIKYSNTKAF